MLTVGSAVGLVVLYSRIPTSYFESFVWVDLLVWMVGIGMWLTLGLAAFEFFRARLPRMQSLRITERSRTIASIATLSVAAVAATLVVTFPYGDQFVLDFQTNKRDALMASIVERHVRQGPVGIGIRYTGSDPYQIAADEHGVAYLLITAGWVPGLEPGADTQSGLPIRPHNTFVVFDERGATLTGFRVYPRYEPLTLLSHSATPRTTSPKD